jgi:anti-sigma regulatory factor (Ser/Thr protein kinase)
VRPLSSAGPCPAPATGLRHEALFHAGTGGFLEAAVPLAREAISAGEPILIMVSPARINALRERLGDSEGVSYADMREVGRNPARIIPAWRDFVDRHAGSPRLHGIGEPIWAGRSAAALAECHLHEALLNVAFADGPDFRLMCPYDTQSLEPAELARARHTHPILVEQGSAGDSRDYRERDVVDAGFGEPLSEPPAGAPQLRFHGQAGVGEVRAFLRAALEPPTLAGERLDDLLLAASEVATNSICHGGGGGTARVWQEPDGVVCEIRDDGRIGDPLVGRHRPGPDQIGSWGLWIANQMCDLVQVRTSARGTAVRMHLAD